tara:strand:+ start:4095 stop:5801 length:1707 start_codon:yes stop_codon:yes gene_type:complete
VSNKRTLRLSGVQASFPVGALDGNKEKIAETLTKIEEVESDIAIFPELALTGYPPEDLMLRESFVGKNYAKLEEISALSGETAAIIGFVDRSIKDTNNDAQKRGIANAAAIVQNGDVKGIYHKCFLPNYSVFDEARYFDYGKNQEKIFWFDDIGVGINICEDVWIGQGPAEAQVEAGASIIININASPFDIFKSDSRRDIVTKKSKELGVPFFYLNIVGGQDELVFDGGSFVTNSDGNIIYEAEQFKEELFHLDIEVEIKETPEISDITLRNSPKKLTIPKSKRRNTKYESIYNALVLGLRDYVAKNNFEKVLVGISGGIDSALTVAIACDSLGPDNVIGIAMPSKYSKDSSLRDAKELASCLKFDLKVIPIEDAANVYRSLISGTVEEDLSSITDQNIQSRVRGGVLMGVSNQINAMVVATGNKSEMAVGYATLYGDLVGGFALLKDLYKTEVFELAKYRNKVSRVIPTSIIQKKPSAELKDNQFDTDSLPEYEVLDKILNMYIEDNASSEDIVNSGIDKSIVFDVLNKVDRSEYKRRQVAPGVKLTSRAFGKDRRVPISVVYERSL